MSQQNPNWLLTRTLPAGDKLDATLGSDDRKQFEPQLRGLA